MVQESLTIKQIVNQILGRALEEIRGKTGLILDAKLSDGLVSFFQIEEPSAPMKPFTLPDLEKIVVETLRLNTDSDEEPPLRILSRKRDLVDGRAVFTRLGREYGFTYSSIGRYMNRDHTTAIHLFQKSEDLLTTDPTFQVKYQLTHAKLKEKYASVV